MTAQIVPHPLDDPAPTRVRTLHSALWALLGAGGRYALTGLTTLALTRLLEPADFGLIAITALAQLLIEYILTNGFQDALVQRPTLDRAALDSAFWSVSAITGLAALVVSVAAAPLAEFYDEPRLAPLLIGIALAALLRAAGTVPRALLHRRMSFRALAVIRVVALLVAGIGAITLALLGAGAWSLVAHAALLNVTDTLLIAIIAGYRPTVQITRRALFVLWRFALSVTAFTALNTVIGHADDQIIGFRLGADPLGYYTMAYTLMMWPVEGVIGGFAIVLYPVLSRLQDNLPRLRRAYLEGLQLTALVAFPLLSMLAISGPILVRWLLGENWNPAVLVLQILSVGGMRASAGMLPIYRAIDKPHLHTWLELASVPCYLTAFVVGVQHGIEGVALLWVLTGFMLQPLSWYLLWRAAGIALHRWLAAVIPAAVATLSMAITAWAVLSYTAHNGALSDAARLVLMGLLAGGVYVLVLVALRPPALVRSLNAARQLARDYLGK